MENASKALLIAGSILLFILLSSFASYMFTRARSRTTEIYGMMSSSNVDTFNQKFIKYEDRKLKIQDVISIINFAKDCNNNGRQSIEVKVTTASGIIEGVSGTNLLADDIDMKFLLENNLNKEYKCTASYGNNSNLIENIYIENY